MVQHFLHVSVLTFIMHQIRILMHPRNLLRRPRIDPKKHSHSHKRHEVESRSASDQYYDESDEPQIPSSKPKKHVNKSRHKVRSRYMSSSEEDQSSATRHRSSKPSGALSDQDQPQHDPDHPYYTEVALSDVPSQYAEEVDTFRCILSYAYVLNFSYGSG